MRSLISFISLVVKPVYIAVLCAIILRGALQAYSVPSDSMSPTLRAGDHVLVTRFGREPKRGDVVVFRHPDNPQQLLVKRIVAMPGDHVEVRDGFVRLNGAPVAEPFVVGRSLASHGPEIVPAGAFFVLGDRRADSVDSRSFGFVPLDSVVGRARLIFWSSGAESPYRAVAAQASAAATSKGRGVNWSRVFTVVR